MVSPAQKKQAVANVVSQRLCSERRACRYLGVHRSTYRYPVKSTPPQQVQLHQRIVALSWQYPRYGYRRIRALLEREGWSVSRKQVQRIRRKEGLKVRPKPPRIPRQGVSTGLPTQATHRNDVWTWDFIFDRTDKGSTLKMLTMLDEYTRQCLAIRVERQIRSEQVLATLWQAMTTYGIPEHIIAITAPNLSRIKSRHGCETIRLKRSISIRAAPGKTATSRAFIAVSATNASIVNGC